MPRLVRTYLLAAGAALAAAACRDGGGPVAPNETQPDALTRAAPTGQEPARDPIALGRTVRGFGGFFLDRAGVATVYLTDPGRRGEAVSALAPWFRAQGLDPNQLRVLKGDFDYADLERWFAAGSPAALGVAGAVFADLDEGANRLRFGAENPAAAQGIRTALSARGIPAGAVIVEQAEPIRFVATLQDQIRPTLLGGLQINFSRFLCTLGFNATSGTQRSFVTASHCTDKQGGVEGTQYYQPLSPQFGGTGGVVAIEVADPTYFKGGACPRGRICRYSDAARAAYTDSVGSALGQIERTTGVNDGSLTIAGSFTINAEGDGVQGGTANKVGRTTGWSQGPITNTCVTTNVSGSRITLLCQNFVSAQVGAGDSGSPVFLGSGSGSVTLAGVLWGGNQSGTLFVYSPMSGVERELGPLTTF